jgi:hypothetical protein
LQGEIDTAAYGIKSGRIELFSVSAAGREVSRQREQLAQDRTHLSSCHRCFQRGRDRRVVKVRDMLRRLQDDG